MTSCSIPTIPTADFARLHALRQQMAKRDGRPNLALSDFTAPVDPGVEDFVGAFAVTAGVGLDEARKNLTWQATTTRRSCWRHRRPAGRGLRRVAS